jgi:hypothetical protein
MSLLEAVVTARYRDAHVTTLTAEKWATSLGPKYTHSNRLGLFDGFWSSKQPTLPLPLIELEDMQIAFNLTGNKTEPPNCETFLLGEL